MEKGNVLQINHKKEIVKCFHGSRLMSFMEVKREYGSVLVDEKEMEKGRYILIHIQGARSFIIIYYIHIHIHTHTHTYTYIHIHILIHIQGAWSFIIIYTYIHTHTHTHTYTV